MDYQVSARKYRPGTFDDVIGQPHIVQTLLNAVSSKRIAHAYLFSGTRGVGKTTVARILAGLAGAFVLGAAIAFPMARAPAFDRFFGPLLNFFQGIPALSWVVFAIIWFKGTEPRIFFIMVVTSLPAFR